MLINHMGLEDEPIGSIMCAQLGKKAAYLIASAGDLTVAWDDVTR